MNTKTVLGHIDCPTCGAKMRVTHDKNSHPFGYCETGCGQQLRVGGNPSRVREFVKRYPWAAGAPVTANPSQEQEKIPVTVTEQKPAPEPEKKPAPRSAIADALSALGVR